MPSSADPALEAVLTAAADAIVDALAGLPAAVVLLDGRSGSGKTTLAAELSRRLTGEPQIVALDDLYPGWDGMDAGVQRAVDDVLAPRAAGRTAIWRRWDWDRGAYAEEHLVDPARSLILEGSGILTPCSARLADLRVWVDAPETSRRRRALDRDGDTYRPHWEGWARQELHHLDRDDPPALADLVVSAP